MTVVKTDKQQPERPLAWRYNWSAPPLARRSIHGACGRSVRMSGANAQFAGFARIRGLRIREDGTVAWPAGAGHCQEAEPAGFSLPDDIE